MSDKNSLLNQDSVPFGWNWNPSHRRHRYRLLPIAAMGFLVALYLALCQIGSFLGAWDPVFHDGSNRVLHSSISKALPVPDAALGAAVYLLEVTLLILGPNDRWLKKPWLTFLSGLAAFALAGAGIALMFLQPTFVLAWCLWCLLLTGLSLILLMKSAPEFLAFLQSWILVSRYNLGTQKWFFGKAPDDVSDRLVAKQKDLAQFPQFQGMHYPWTLFACLGLGVLAFILPELFPIIGVGKITIEFCGAVTIGASLLSLVEPLRFFRWINGATGSLLFFWFLGQPMGIERWFAAGIGVGLLGLCVYRGRLLGKYGFFSSPSFAQVVFDQKQLEPQLEVEYSRKL